MTETPTTFEFQLGSALHQAARRDRRRRRQRTHTVAAGLIAGTVAAAVPLIGAMLPVPGSAPGVAQVAIAHQSGVVAVRLSLGETVDPDAIEARLAHAGVDVEVELVPADPALVGRFVAIESPDRQAAPEFSPSVAYLSSDVDGFRLFIGRAAAPGEAPMFSSSAFDPGGAMWCRSVHGQPAADAAAWFATNGIEVRWLDMDAPTAALTADVPDGYVSHSSTDSSGVAVVGVTAARPGPADGCGDR